MTTRIQVLVRLLASAAVSLTAGAAVAQSGGTKLDAVTFGTNWLAQAEQGGYYQALADGTYKKFVSAHLPRLTV
ncbi:MAG: hypothetical protein ACRYG8_53150 [Janthinobacterium lividum]